MIDFTNTHFRASFTTERAARIKDEYEGVISKGSQTSRMRLTKDSDIHSIAVHSAFSKTPPKLSSIERLYVVIVKVKNEQGEEGYVKVNANSLRKRLGMSKSDLRAFSKDPKGNADASKAILNKIEAICATQFTPGQVQRILKDGTTYVGEWENGEPNGKGKYFMKNGETYEGNFVNGLQHGQGRYYWNVGAVYTGEWQNGRRNGKGTLTWPGEFEYVGTFANSNPRGDDKEATLTIKGKTYEKPDRAQKLLQIITELLKKAGKTKLTILAPDQTIDQTGFIRNEDL